MYFGLRACIYVWHVCPMFYNLSQSQEKGVRALELELQGVLSHSTWVSGTEFRSPEKEQVCLTVPPFKYI